MQRHLRITTVLVICAATVLICSGAAAAAPTGSTFLVSRPAGAGPVPAPGDNDSGTPLAVSADGRYVAFASAADGFAPGADPRFENVFLRDRTANTTTLVSRSDGAAGDGVNADIAVGTDGRLGVAVVPGAQALDAPHDTPHVMVVFSTEATNVVDHATGAVAPTGGAEEVWLRDVTAGTTYLVSRVNGARGAPANVAAAQPSIATGPKGPVVAFNSRASNLGASGPSMVYLRDVNAGTTQLVSCPGKDCAAANPSSTHVSNHPSVQFVQDPHFTPCQSGSPCVLVAFASDDPTLTGDANTNAQIVVAAAGAAAGSIQRFTNWSLVSRTTVAPSHPATGSSLFPVLSADGQNVAFRSDAPDLVFPPLPQGSGSQAFLSTSLGGGSQLISRTPNGEPADADDVSLGGTGVGMHVGFTSRSLDPDPFFQTPHPYDAPFSQTPTPVRLDRASGSAGVVGDQQGRAPVISADGSTAVFTSASDNIDPQSGTDFVRVYARGLASNALDLVSRPSGTGAFGGGSQTATIPRDAVSSDGRYVAFQSQADDLSGQDDNHLRNVFVRDTLTGTVTLVNRAGGPDGAAGNTDASVGGISDDGRRVVFSSGATNLGASVPGRLVYVRDLDSQTTTVVSRANGPTGTIADGEAFGISGDGSSVVFSSPFPLDPAADDGQPHLYVRNLPTQTTTLVDRDDGVRGRLAEREPDAATIDRDGNRVAWTTSAPLPGSGTSLKSLDRVYVRDLRASQTIFVSRADGATGDEPTAGSANPSIDAAGDAVAFESAATNLGAAIAQRQIWLRHIDTGHTLLVSRADGASGAVADNESLAPSLDAAGDRVAFMSRAGNLGAGKPSGVADIHAYLRDVPAGATELVTRANGVDGAPSDSPGFGTVSLSPNGNCAAFSSRGLNLDDGFASVDFFAVRERVLRGECPVAGPVTEPQPSPSPSPPSPLPAPPTPSSPPRAVLDRLALTPKRFHVGGRGGGTTIGFRLSRAARVTLNFERRLAGHRRHGRCVAGGHKGSRCTVFKRVGTRVIARGRAGANKSKFSGRFGHRTLAPGRYRLTATPTGGAAHRTPFTVVAAPRRHHRH